MEAFSLLKYWRGGGGSGGGSGGDVAANIRPTVATIVTAVSKNAAETDDNNDDDDGPFFDLEFAVNDDDEAEVGDEDEENTSNREEPSSGVSGSSLDDSDLDEEEAEVVVDDDDDEDEDEECNGEEVDEREFNFTLSSGSSNDRTDTNLALSPSDDLFFKGKLVPIESSSIVFSPSEANSKPAQFPVSLLKSATKFRVFMLGLKKSRSNATSNNNIINNGGEKTEPVNGSVSSGPKQEPKKQETQQKDPLEKHQSQKNQQQGKFFTVKLKVEEVPIVSLFTRDNSSRISNKPQKQTSENEAAAAAATAAAAVSSEEKRFAKEVVQKYLKMVKPLYVRVSRRYGEKLKVSGQLSLNGSVAKAATSPPASTVAQKPNPTEAPAPAPTSAPAPAACNNSAGEKSSQTVEPEASEAPANTNANKSLKQVNLPAGLRVVCKHLGKSRSASSTAAVAPSGTAASKRRDDSLLQQQDGIQSAILHCKRSFNAARDSESNLLSRCASDPSNEKSLDLSRKPSDLAKCSSD